MLGLQSTDELIRKLKQHPNLAGAANFKPGEIPSKSTFSRRRMVVPLDDLKAILHELVEVLVHCKVIDGRAWVVDPTRRPTYSSVSKTYPDRPNGKSDPEAAFSNLDQPQLKLRGSDKHEIEKYLPEPALQDHGRSNRTRVHHLDHRFLFAV